MFFDDWTGIVRVVIMSVLGYSALIILLRTSGKRTLSKMNVFDFVVTIALGSMLASIILSKDIALLEGVVALSVLIYMQFAIAWLSTRSDRFLHMVKGQPTLLFYNGEIMHESAKRERVSSPEIFAAIREDGFGKLSEVGAVILETDGTFTTLPRSIDPLTTLEYVNQRGANIQ